MSCQNCGNITKTCGCSDTPYTTPIPVTCVPACPPKCAEYYDSRCVLVQDGIDELESRPGDSVEELLQRLTLLVTNPTCVGKATPYVYTTTILPTSIVVNWEGVSNALSYQVEYKVNDPGVVVWSQLPTQTSTSATITGLTTSTSYLIRVVTVTVGPVSCTSVTIVNNTL